MPLKAAITHSKKLKPMFVVAINEIFLLTLHVKRTSVEEVLAFWEGLAGITGDIRRQSQREELFILLHSTVTMMQI